MFKWILSGMLILALEQANSRQMVQHGTQYRLSDGSYEQRPSKAEFLWVYDSIYENSPDEMDFLFHQRCYMKYLQWREWYLRQEGNKYLEDELQKFHDSMILPGQVAVDGSR